MGFGICVFTKEAAPRKLEDFTAWYEEQTYFDAASDITYDDISICPEQLKNWYETMLSRFPAMDGRDAESSQLAYMMMQGENNYFARERMGVHTSNYVIKQYLISFACAWSLADEAYVLARTTARECGLAFFDISFNRIYFSDTEVLRLPFDDEESEKYSLSLPLIVPMDFAREWIANMQNYLYGKTQEQSQNPSQPPIPQKKEIQSAWYRWFFVNDMLFSSRKEMYKIGGTLLEILIFSAIIAYLSPIKIVWVTAGVIMSGALMVLLTALIHGIYHYYKTGHFFLE